MCPFAFQPPFRASHRTGRRILDATFATYGAANPLARLAFTACCYSKTHAWSPTSKAIANFNILPNHLCISPTTTSWVQRRGKHRSPTSCSALCHPELLRVIAVHCISQDHLCLSLCRVALMRGEIDLTKMSQVEATDQSGA